MADINSFLNKISKNINFIETEREKKQHLKEDEAINFNVSPIQKTQNKSISELVKINSDKSFVNEVTNKGLKGNNEEIREIIKEELDKFKIELAEFFAEKTLLQESEDKETIVLKIGNHVFKGKMSLVQ